MTPSDPGASSRSMPPGFPVSPLPSHGASGSMAEMTITGQVEAGVEAGCLLLHSDGTAYVLVGGDRGIVRAGARVTVRGRPNPDLVTTCMQGVPFEVMAAQTA